MSKPIDRLVEELIKLLQVKTADIHTSTLHRTYFHGKPGKGALIFQATYVDIYPNDAKASINFRVISEDGMRMADISLYCQKVLAGSIYMNHGPDSSDCGILDYWVPVEPKTMNRVTAYFSDPEIQLTQKAIQMIQWQNRASEVVARVIGEVVGDYNSKIYNAKENKNGKPD